MSSEAADTEANQKQIWILVFKEQNPILPSQLRLIESLNYTLTCHLHWALRVGDDVFDLVVIDEFSGEIEYRCRKWEAVRHRYQEKEYKGTTCDSRQSLIAEAERVELKFRTETRGYDFVVANCQEFVRQLERRIVKTSCSSERTGHPDLWEDILGYLRKAHVDASSGMHSLKEVLDKLLKRIKYLLLIVLGDALRTIITAIRDLLVNIWTTSGQTLAWLIEGLQELVQCLRPLSGKVLQAAVDGFNKLVELAAPLLKQLSNAPAEVLESLPSGLLIGLAAILVAGGLWLAWEGFAKFRKWWKKGGRIVIQTEEHEFQILREDPAVVVRRAARARPVVPH